MEILTTVVILLTMITAALEEVPRGQLARGSVSRKVLMLFLHRR